MGRKKAFTSLLVTALVICSFTSANAQDMVFTAQDTGEVAEAPPPPSGPPSEPLANALRLYQQESYAQAAVQFQRVVQKETRDEPANVQKAQFFLGKCFYHMKFYQAALGVFEEIAMMSTGHLYFQTTLQWLAQLSRELPEPAGIIGLVGRYGDSISVLQEFNQSETADLYNELLYLMGRHWYQKGEFAKARDFFLEIDQNDENYVRAVFFVGITHVRERRAQPASKAFLSIVNKYDGKLFLSDEEERFLNLAWLSLARIYYSTKHYESAMEAWSKVPQSSEYYLDALFEESWAFFQVDQLDRALGNIHTINSPYFEESFYPESIVLKAVIYFGMCMFEDAQFVVDSFRKKYEPFQAELQKTLKQFKDNKSFFDFLTKIRRLDSRDEIPTDDEDDDDKKDSKSASKTSMGFSSDILMVVKGALSDRTLLRHIDYVDMLNEEETKLKAMPAVFINSAAGIRIQQDINTAKTVAVDNTGNLVRARYERLLAEIHDFLNQGTRVEIEILKALRGELDIEIAAEQEVTGPTIEEQKIKSDAEHQLWPFEGEFWRDELGYYRQPITNRCGR
jgi:tetratricopeptide (TPR) repeat protein